MEIQKQVLLFFSGIHTGVLNTLAQIITIFGEEFLLIAVAVFVYWNVNKKKGFVICMSLLNALTAMGISKAVIRFPRPWTRIENLETVRQHTATGYSFPSGHTTCAASTYGAIAVEFKKRWLSIICAVMIALVGISRMYLCVHWPMDVFGGLVIGCGSALLLSAVFERLFDDKERSIRVATVLAVVMMLLSVVFSILLVLEKVDFDAFDDLNITFAIYGGLALGYTLERKTYDYEIEEGRWGRKVIRYLVGMTVVAAILFGLKAVFNAVGIYNSATRALRYFLVGFWGCYYPVIGRKTGLFD